MCDHSSLDLSDLRVEWDSLIEADGDDDHYDHYDDNHNDDLLLANERRALHIHTNKCNCSRPFEPYRLVNNGGGAVVMRHENATSLSNALFLSLFETEYEKCKPLLIWLCRQKSIATNIFSDNIMASNDIIQLLSSQFIVWMYDIVTDSDFHSLLTAVSMCLGPEILGCFENRTVDSYPLMLCLSFENGRIIVTRLIDGVSSKDEILRNLQEALFLFDAREVI